MENLAQVFTKETTEGDDKMTVLQPGQALIQKMNLGDWEEIRMGMFFSYTNLSELNGEGSVSSANIPAFDFDDPGILWSFGMKDDDRSSLVDHTINKGRFLGIHPNTNYGTFSINLFSSSGGDTRQHFALQRTNGQVQFPYLAKNGDVNNTAETNESQGDPPRASFGMVGRDLTETSDKFAQIMALRFRKIPDDKIRIWYGGKRGHQDFGNITLANLGFLLDNFMTELDPFSQTPVDIDDPFISGGDYPDSFYFYGSFGLNANFRWRVGAFIAKRYDDE